MPRQRKSNLESLLKLPWWVSVVLGVVIFIAMVWIIPAQLDHNQTLHPFAVALPKLAFLPLGFFVLLAIFSFLFAKKRRRLVDEQSSLEKLRESDFKDFEYLVAEMFRRQGYEVDYSLGRGADGGVDLKLNRAGRISIVQCKHWKVFSVGAPIIREMFGLMTAVKAAEAIIVTVIKILFSDTLDTWNDLIDSQVSLNNIKSRLKAECKWLHENPWYKIRLDCVLSPILVNQVVPDGLIVRLNSELDKKVLVFLKSHPKQKTSVDGDVIGGTDDQIFVIKTSPYQYTDTSGAIRTIAAYDMGVIVQTPSGSVPKIPIPVAVR